MDSIFSYEGYTDDEGKLIVRDLLVGQNKYEISFLDLNGDLWKRNGTVFIKNGSWEKKSVELKKEN